MRIALAKVLVRRPENVLLDEPTNHLDAKTRAWLASELQDWAGAILIVTHDGDFLDRVATRILDLRDRKVESYAGNYTQYQRQKAERLQAQDQAAARQERELDKQERFIERFRAKAIEDHAVQSREKALAKIERIEHTPQGGGGALRAHRHGRTERDVLMLKHVGHAYGDNLVLLDVNLHVERGPEGRRSSGRTGAARARSCAIAAGLMRADRGRGRVGRTRPPGLLRPAPGRGARPAPGR